MRTERSREKKPKIDNESRKDEREKSKRQKQRQRQRPRRDFRQRNAIGLIKSEKKSVNRVQICPFLARIYYCVNGKNNYDGTNNFPADRELILYLWMDSTLKEITDLLRAHMPDIRTKQRFVFSRVYEQNNMYHRKQMGTVMVHKKDKKGYEGDEVTLQSRNFFIGDYIDVSINYK